MVYRTRKQLVEAGFEAVLSRKPRGRGIFAPRGGAWSAAQVRAAIARIPASRGDLRKAFL
jgi:hypothetical protein